jgi:hypothetical protein
MWLQNKCTKPANLVVDFLRRVRGCVLRRVLGCVLRRVRGRSSHSTSYSCLTARRTVQSARVLSYSNASYTLVKVTIVAGFT